MAGCNINITSVEGVYTQRLTPTICQTLIAISGTVTTSPQALGCPVVTVSATCQYNSTTNQTYSGTIDRNGVVTGQVASGFLVGDNWQVYLWTYCCCGSQVAVNASCPSLNCSASETVSLQCQSKCCPTITTHVDYGDCDGSGNALVTFTVSVNAVTPNGCPETKVQIDYGDGSPVGATQTFSSAGSFTEQHTYSSGPHLAFINVISPTGCTQWEVPINVPCPPAGCCPKITPHVSYDPCDAKGYALVTFDVSVVPTTAAGCPETKVHIDFGDGSPVGATHTFSSAGNFIEPHSYSSGPHTAFVVIESPTGCKWPQIPINVQCPPCCPDVSITPCIPDCDGDANRTVTFQITVTKKPLPCPPTAISIQMDFGDNSNGSLVTIPAGVPSYSYTETHTYTGSAALQANTASLQVSEPPECAGTYSPQNIPACCKKARAAWCNTLFWTMSLALTFALLFLLFWAFPFGSTPATCPTCVPFNLPSSTLLYAFYVLAIIGVVGLIIYLIFCRKCSCGWVYRLLWRILFGVGLLYAIFAGCSMQLLSVIIGLILMLLAFFFLGQWRDKCCVTPCAYLWEILIWSAGLLAIAGVLIAAGTGSGCLYVIFQLNILGFHILITTYSVAVALSVALLAQYHAQCGK